MAEIVKPKSMQNEPYVDDIRQAWDDRKESYTTISMNKAITQHNKPASIPADVVKVPKLRFKEFTSTDGWQVTKVKDIARFQGGKSHEKLIKKEGEGHFTVVNLEFISTNGVEQKTANRNLMPLKQSDIAIVMSDNPKKGNLSKCFYVPKDNAFTLNKHVGRLSIVEQNPLFCYYQINKNEYFKKFDVGFKRINLNKRKVNNCQIFLPSIEEQNKIADIMQEVERCISIQRKKIRKANLLVREAIGKVLKEKTWEWTTVRELVDKNIVKLSRGDILLEHKHSAVYSIPIYTDKKREPVDMTYSDKYMFDEELITWAIDGGGNIQYIKKHKFNVTTDCGIVQFETDKFNYKFAYEMLKMQENDNKKSVENRVYPFLFSHMYKLPDVSMEEQEEMNKWFKELYKPVQKEEKELDKLLKKKARLLEELFA